MFRRRRPEPQHKEKFSVNTAVQAGQLILQTFEHRRNQLITKSTICATAASGIVVLVIQAILTSTVTRFPVRILGVMTVCLAALALLEGLNVIKKLSKRTRKVRSRTHLLYFGTLAALDAETAYTRISNLDEERYLRELASQAVELSRNLRMRYDALGKAYRWLATAIIALVISLVTQQVYTIIGFGSLT